MISKIATGSLRGVDGYIVYVEVDMCQGLPSFDVVGLPDSSVKESRERVRTAIKNSDLLFPIKRITINLAPASTKKEGPAFDLPIAVGILCKMGTIEHEKTLDTFFVGELSLDGSIRGVSGILPMIICAKLNGFKNCVVPIENAQEAALVDGISIIPAENLTTLISHFTNDDKKISPFNVDINSIFSEQVEINQVDFKDVKGQSTVKRALEIAAAGYHNVLMIGPPGSGKTMMAKRFPTILPNLNFDESLEVTKIYSVAGYLHSNNYLITKRPFRSPHHTISSAALTGGGRIPKPGEVSLAHKGVLFLDELPEFHKDALEILRQPLEDKIVNISRVNSTITYPTDFMLLASMNPCPCGYFGEGDKCVCTNGEIMKYQKKISGPLLDRIDIQVEAGSVNYSELNTSNNGKINSPSSEDIKKRVIKAQIIQKERFKNDGITFNSQMSSSLTDKYCAIDDDVQELLKQAFHVMNLSARAYHKILKLARTIADLDDSPEILEEHIGEAIQLRTLDRTYTL